MARGHMGKPARAIRIAAVGDEKGYLASVALASNNMGALTPMLTLLWPSQGRQALLPQGLKCRLEAEGCEGKQRHHYFWADPVHFYRHSFLAARLSFMLSRSSSTRSDTMTQRQQEELADSPSAPLPLPSLAPGLGNEPPSSLVTNWSTC
ncbi:hypothetical protein GOP47_0004131 [Adiantum capillus-veneris]|uniref:Uncharacterized protein n=1 Tax=Adiantum capillus-veneris TaxID=13818 RepID=A0A9D4ZMA9_ADICA|nr:hypothetical protein GOP47_0004131 [Adiantum capillus-veneris]